MKLLFKGIDDKGDSGTIDKIHKCNEEDHASDDPSIICSGFHKVPIRSVAQNKAVYKKRRNALPCNTEINSRGSRNRNAFLIQIKESGKIREVKRTIVGA